MGTAYFVLKNTVLTLVIVSFLQIKLGSKTLETYLMGFVRETLAPKFLGHEPIEIDGSMRFNKNQVESIKQRFRKSEFYKEAKEGVKETLMEEIQSLYNDENAPKDENKEEPK